MRQYFMGFFSALCLSASFYLFTEANYDKSGNNEKDQIILVRTVILENCQMLILYQSTML